MFVSTLGGKLNGGTLTVGPFPPGGTDASSSQKPIARHNGGPQTGEAKNPITATAIGTIHGTLEEPSDMTG